MLSQTLAHASSGRPALWAMGYVDVVDSRRALVAIPHRLFACFRWLILQLLLGLVCLGQQLFDLLLERIKVPLQGGGGAFAALELLHGLQRLSEPASSENEGCSYLGEVGLWARPSGVSVLLFRHGVVRRTRVVVAWYASLSSRLPQMLDDD
jgi:hypothetical protein